MFMKSEQIEIGKLFDDLLKEGRRMIHADGYDLIYVGDMDILTIGNRYVRMNYISRHKTSKNLVEITAETCDGENSVTVTTDHICMVYTHDRLFENVAAKNLKIGDRVSVYDEKRDAEIVGTVERITDLGPTDEYVYDCEVDDDNHCFYANSICCHNSQFSNIRCITEEFARRFNLPKSLSEWPDEKKLELWDFVENIVNTEVTPFVQKLVKDWCHTNGSEVLRYSLEYIADTGIYQAKKNYAVHKCILEGRKLADKIVYKGIELKKGNLDKSVKGILAPIYENALKTDYKEDEFRKYIADAYERFCKMPIEDISFWKGYNTERKSSGFLEMEKVVAEDGHTIGTTSVSAAGTYYNQLLEKLGIGDKYESILLGDKIRFCYVKCSKYPIKYIAFKNRWPKEFDEIMQIDYWTMFDKTVMKPLERFFLASGFEKFDPSKVFSDDIDDL